MQKIASSTLLTLKWAQLATIIPLVIFCLVVLITIIHKDSKTKTSTTWFALTLMIGADLALMFFNGAFVTMSIIYHEFTITYEGADDVFMLFLIVNFACQHLGICKCGLSFTMVIVVWPLYLKTYQNLRRHGSDRLVSCCTELVSQETTGA